MADTKTTGLTELTVAAAADLLYIVDDVAGTPIGKKITLANLAANLGAIAGTGVTLTGGTVTDSAPIMNGSQTWNDVTKTFVLDSMNVTDTASAAASLLWERKLNSQRKHQFTKTGLEIFRTWTSDSVYEKGSIDFSGAGDLLISTSHVGATNRGITFAPASGIINLANGTEQLIWTNRFRFRPPSDGVMLLSNGAGTDVNRVQWGGTTASFPSIKRSAAILQARLADDSAFATLQGKLQTDAAYTAGDPTTTGYIILYDSTGTAYRIPALLHS